MESRISHFVMLSYFDGVLWNICFHLLDSYHPSTKRIKTVAALATIAGITYSIIGWRFIFFAPSVLESSTQETYLFYQDSCILRLFLQPQENIPCQTLTYWELHWLLIRESSFLSQTIYSLLSYTF